MNYHKIPTSFAIVCCAALAMLAPSVYAETGAVAGVDAPRQAEKVIPQSDTKISEQRKKIIQEAVDAVSQTKKALKALAENRSDDALALLAEATGELELIIARDPELALAPVDVSVSAFDLYASEESIRDAINEVKSLLKRGEIQAARRLLSGIRSELVVSVTHIPLATYPDAIKAVTPMIDAGKTDEATAALQAALNTLVLIDEVIALPVVRSEALLQQAEVLAEKEDRSESENKELTELLSAARSQLQMAELLGYGDKSDYKPLYRQLDKIEDETDEGQSGSGFFDRIKAGIKNI